MRPLRYSINITLDGCVDHEAGLSDGELHRHHAKNLEEADALLFGRVVYQMMEGAWREPAETGVAPDWMGTETMAFAKAIHAAKKYVVSRTLEQVDWHAELLRGDLATAVRELKRQPGKGLLTGGVTLPLALAQLDLIDEYDIVVAPRIAGRGPTLLTGVSKFIDLQLVHQHTFDSGAVLMRYVPRR